MAEVEGGGAVVVADEDVRRSVLKTAKDGNVAEMQRIVESGVNVEGITDSVFGRTPFMTACWNNQVALVRYLKEHTVIDVEREDRYGDTALRWACWGEESAVAVVKLLVEEMRANVDQYGRFGCSPFFEACYGGPLDIVRYLAEECGADVEEADVKGWTPFRWASRCWMGNVNVVAYLAERAEEVDVFEVEGGRVSIAKEYLRDIWQLNVH